MALIIRLGEGEGTVAAVSPVSESRDRKVRGLSFYNTQEPKVVWETDLEIL